MKKKAEKAALAACLIICLGLAVYPICSNLYYETSQDLMIETYEENAETISDEQQEEEREACREYNRTLLQTTTVFLNENGVNDQQMKVIEERQELYLSLLNRNSSGLMGYLVIPAIDVTLPVYHNADEESLEKGLGHMAESSLPVGGESTHAVITGHSGMAGKRMFSDLTELKIGDRFYFSVLGEELCYEVDQILTVLPDETDALQVVEGEDYMTLMTCVPYGINSHRLLVRGKRVEESEDSAEEASEVTIQSPSSAWLWEYLKALGIGVLIAVGAAGGYVIVSRNRKQK